MYDSAVPGDSRKCVDDNTSGSDHGKDVEETSVCGIHDANSEGGRRYNFVDPRIATNIQLC